MKLEMGEEKKNDSGIDFFNSSMAFTRSPKLT